MHIYFEPLERPASFSDCKIVFLSWMGRVSDAFLQSFNDEQQQEDNWKFNHIKYYEEGWLATGNQRGIVGITYTSCKCPSKLNKLSMPFRTNYNLRGHRSEIKFVKWNEPFQKLATVDSNGTIFVWIKDNRWSIELINDREVQVVDFNWSHDGRMAVITYLDGFILIGSVQGQRFWSSLLNLESNQMTTGVWSPDDRHVVIGVSNGSFLVLNLNGAILAEFMLKENVSVTKMAWSTQKFTLDEQDINTTDQLNDNVINLDLPNPDSSINNSQQQSNISHEFRVNSPFVGRVFDDLPSENKDETLNNCFKSMYKQHVLAICFEDGYIFLLKSYDDPFPVKINTKLLGIQFEWSNKGEILAVGGHLFNMIQSNATDKQPHYINVIKFYATSNGHLRYVINLNYTLSPITAITWAHNDRRLFIATGNCVHTAWVTKKMPKLQLLSRLAIKQFVNKEQNVRQLQLPVSLRILIRSLFVRTLRCHLPDLNNLRDFCINAPPTNMRYYCTLIRHVPKDSCRDARNKLFSTYILYLEYLGGLIPILKGKRTSKLKPEFVIYDPQSGANKNDKNDNNKELLIQNCFSRFDNRRSSIRRIAYFVPQINHSNSSTKKPQSIKSIDPRNGMASTSDCELDDTYQQTQSNIAIETLPSSIYQSFLKRKLCRHQKNDRSTAEESSNLLISNPYSTENDLILNNHLNSSLNNLINQNNSSLTNQHETTEQTEPETSNPLVLTLLGHNPIIFTRRRAINSTSQANSIKKLTYVDEMPENKKFLLITSNIWGTKFKFIGLASWLPSTIGCISYKTSLLHLQPRQMQLQIKEMMFTPSNLNNNCFRDRITENVLKSCESNSDLNNVDEDVEWNNTSFEDDDYIKKIPVAPLSPQFLNGNYATTKLASPIEFSTIEDYLTFQIDPSNEQINCNLTFSSNQSNHLNSTSSNNKFYQRSYKDDNHLHLLHSLQPTAATLTNSVSTQTSFPSSLNNLNNQSESLLENNSEDDEFNTMNTLASCSRLIHSSSMICSGKNANQLRSGCHVRLEPSVSGSFTKRLINRNSLDLSLRRRLTLKSIRRPLSSYSLKLDNRTKCILNCMYLDEEEIEEDKNCTNLDKTDEAITFDYDGEMNKNDDEEEVKLYNRINRIHSSNESLLLESYCFDDQQLNSTSNTKLTKEDSDPSSLMDKCFINTNMPPATPVHKRKLLIQSNESRRERKDLNNNAKNQFNSFRKPPFFYNDSFDDDESESDEIQMIGSDVESSHRHRNRLCNSTSDLLIEQNEFNNESRINLKDRMNFISDQFDLDSSTQDGQQIRTIQRAEYVSMSNNSRLSFINRSLPTTPTIKSKSKDRKRSIGKALLYSPIMIRKAMKQRLNYFDCSSDDGLSDDDAPYSMQTTTINNQSTQQQRQNNKSKRKQSFCLIKRKHSLNKVQPNNDDTTYSLNNSTLKELIMHNKAPVWNELSQVYQLDFGGRVTQESAKNFQIEFNDKQVLQFGRIDVNAYTLDFQQPFCALQALSVALANVTQRLK